MAKLVNFLGFQLVWFACVVAASHQYLWAGLAVATVFACMTLMLSKTVAADVTLVVVALVVGGALDTAWAMAGILHYEAAPWGVLSPPWILGLWMGFAMTLNHSLAWLRFKPLWMAALAAIACPFSYYAGLRFGAVEWGRPVLMLTLVPLTWGVFLALLCTLNRKLLYRGEEHVATVV